MALSLNMPVYVALQQKPDQTCKSHYWARYSDTKKQLLLPTNTLVVVSPPSNCEHFEIIHIHNNHYNIVNRDDTLPMSPPYTGESSSSIKQTIKLD